MQFALLALAAGLAYAAPQGVTQAIAPPSGPPPGCVETYDGTFTIAKAVNGKRQLNPSQIAPDAIILTLQDGVMKASTGDTAYIASNRQFQFDDPPQTGAIYTAGFSICPNMTIGLGDSTVFYQCESGNILNIYDRPAESACSPIFLAALPLSGSGAVATSAPAATTPAVTSVPVATTIADGQPQAPSGVVTTLGDGQPQAPSAVYTPPPVITTIADGQPQAPSGTGYVPAPPVPSVPASSGNKMVGGSMAALAAAVAAVML